MPQLDSVKARATCSATLPRARDQTHIINHQLGRRVAISLSNPNGAAMAPRAIPLTPSPTIGRTQMLMGPNR
jgi:hypothetical protein